MKSDVSQNYSTAGSSPDKVEELIRQGEYISRKLATQHYENFAVAARFLPGRRNQDLFNIYAYCRLADDFADEESNPAKANSALDRWEYLLETSIGDAVSDPLFTALADTIRRRRLSLKPFKDLLNAFRQDLCVKRYKSYSELNDYTKLSADPVGRIVLELHNHRNTEYFALSDKICTALQLANHWQDVLEDFYRGRIYIPVEDMERFEVTEDMILKKQANSSFRELMRFEVERARKLFCEGRELINLVDRTLRVQLEMYWGGGVAALNAIQKVEYDVLNNKTPVTNIGKAKIALRGFSRLFY